MVTVIIIIAIVHGGAHAVGRLERRRTNIGVYIICMYVYIYIYITLHIIAYQYIYIYTHTYTTIYTYIYIYIHIIQCNIIGCITLNKTIKMVLLFVNMHIPTNAMLIVVAIITVERLFSSFHFIILSTYVLFCIIYIYV